MSDFLAEGGYAAYVWPAYLISAAAIVWLLLQTLHAYRKAKAEVERLTQTGDRAP